MLIVTFQDVCKTDTGHLCVFPFKFGGVIYDKCTFAGKSTKAWCAYGIEAGAEVPKYWGLGNDLRYGDCISSCPIEG